MEEKGQPQVTEDLTRDAERIWEDPRTIMNLIDLLFMWEDPDRKQMPS